MVRYFLEKGASPSLRTNSGEGSLHVACNCAHSNIVSYLLALKSGPFLAYIRATWTFPTLNLRITYETDEINWFGIFGHNSFDPVNFITLPLVNFWRIHLILLHRCNSSILNAQAIQIRISATTITNPVFGSIVVAC
jgi:hypothetical protein